MPLNSERVRTERFCPTDESRRLEQEAKDAICEVVALNDEQVCPRLKEIILRHLLWQITVVHGKYRTRYRSKGVRDPASLDAKIEHEHVFVLSKLIERLLSKAEFAKEIVKDAIACVVTKAEHDHLSNFNEFSGWERYSRAGIAVYDMQCEPPDEPQFKVICHGDIH